MLADAAMLTKARADGGHGLRNVCKASRVVESSLLRQPSLVWALRGERRWGGTELFAEDASSAARLKVRHAPELSDSLAASIIRWRIPLWRRTCEGGSRARLALQGGHLTHRAGGCGRNPWANLARSHDGSRVARGGRRRCLGQVEAEGCSSNRLGIAATIGSGTARIFKPRISLLRALLISRLGAISLVCIYVADLPPTLYAAWF